MKFKKNLMACATLFVVAAGATALAQTGKPNHWGYSYPRSYDAEIAAPDVHEVHYKDAHVMLMEVSNPPGYQMQMHGHPYPSVFAHDSANPPAGADLTGTARYLDPNSPKNGQNWKNAPPVKGTMFPDCTSADPQAPHMPANGGTWPLHFYRVEFVVADQENMAAAKARDLANTQTMKVLYENDKLQLLEINIRPGAPLPKQPLPAVMAFDSVAAFNAVSGAIGGDAGRSDAPTGMVIPRCITAPPNAVLPKATAASGPIHFYEMAFKRVDGTELKDHWKEWYPSMVEQQKGPLRP
jgi:hypothetical protein